MLIDSYNVFKKDPAKKTKYLLEAFSQVYEPVQRPGKRSGQIVLYVSHGPENTQVNAQRRPALELSGTDGHISGLFIPDPNRPEIGYGDIKGTEDALLFIRSEAQIELFICKGKKAAIHSLYSMLADGDPDLEAEISEHKEQAALYRNCSNK